MRPRLAGPAPRVAVLIVLAGLGAFVLLFRLGTSSWHVDELTYLNAGIAYVDGDYGLTREHPFLGKQIIGLAAEAAGDLRSPAPVRLPGAVFGIGTGLAVFVLASRLAAPTAPTTTSSAAGGFAAGAFAAGAWWLLPQDPGHLDLHIGRYAMLDPPMMFLGAVALALAWLWGRTGRLSYALGAGAALGLAVSSKFPAALFLPAVLLPVLWISAPPSRRAIQAAALLGAAAVGFAVPYLAAGPGDAIAAIRYALEFQSEHSSTGHPVIVAGRTYSHPPWWSHWYWQSQYLGVAGAVAVWSLAAIGLARLDNRARAVLLTALAVPAVAVSAVPLKLPHYHLIWAVPLLAAAGLGAAAGLDAATRLIRQQPPPARATAATRPKSASVVTAATTAVAVAVLVVVAAGQVVTAAQIKPSDYALLPCAAGNANVLVWGYPSVAAAYLGDDQVTADPEIAPIDSAVAVDPLVARRQPDTAIARAVHDRTAGREPVNLGRLRYYPPPEMSAELSSAPYRKRCPAR